MKSSRWVLLVTAAGVRSTGCLGEGATGHRGPRRQGVAIRRTYRVRPSCGNTDPGPQGCPSKPMELTEDSVATYLSDFETGFAWNRILQENDDVNGLVVNTVDGYTPDAADTGYLASSRIDIRFTGGVDHEMTERSSVTNYYVSEGPVYRVETGSDPSDPRTHPDRQLVQCGKDGKPSK